MIRHRNYYEMAAVVEEMPRYGSSGDVLPPLPPSRPQLRAARAPRRAVPRLHGRLRARSDGGCAGALPQVRPTVLPSVPRVYEKVHTAVRRRSPRRPACGADWSTGRSPSAVGRARCARQGSRCHAVSPAQWRRRPARLLEGEGAARGAGCGCRSRAARRWRRRSRSCSTRWTSGSSRGTASRSARARLTTNTSERCRFGTVGQALPGFELRLADDGELMIRSETIFAGYYKDPEATAAVLERRRLAAHGRHRHDRRGRLRHDHRPQEGHHRHRGREEHRSAEPRERPQDVTVRLAGARRRRPSAVSGGPHHPRPGRDRQMGDRAGHRRRRGDAARRTLASSSSCRASSRT